MDERFAPLPDESRLVRLAALEGSHLPRGSVLPLPVWLAPTKDDKKEALACGRVPGLTAWDGARTTVPQARSLAGKPRSLAFATTVEACRTTGRVHEVQVDVVRDPLHDRSTEPGWDGHSLIEGLSRPKGAAGERYDRLRAALVEKFELLA